MNKRIFSIADMTGRGSKKFSDQCSEDKECGFRGSYCDPRTKKCFCREEFEATNYLDKCGHRKFIILFYLIKKYEKYHFIF